MSRARNVVDWDTDQAFNKYYVQGIQMLMKDFPTLEEKLESVLRKLTTYLAMNPSFSIRRLLYPDFYMYQNYIVDKRCPSVFQKGLMKFDAIGFDVAKTVWEVCAPIKGVHDPERERREEQVWLSLENLCDYLVDLPFDHLRPVGKLPYVIGADEPTRPTCLLSYQAMAYFPERSPPSSSTQPRFLPTTPPANPAIQLPPLPSAVSSSSIAIVPPSSSVPTPPSPVETEEDRKQMEVMTANLQELEQMIQSQPIANPELRDSVVKFKELLHQAKNSNSIGMDPEQNADFITNVFSKLFTNAMNTTKSAGEGSSSSSVLLATQQETITVSDIRNQKHQEDQKRQKVAKMKNLARKLCDFKSDDMGPEPEIPSEILKRKSDTKTYEHSKLETRWNHRFTTLTDELHAQIGNVRRQKKANETEGMYFFPAWREWFDEWNKARKEQPSRRDYLFPIGKFGCDFWDKIEAEEDGLIEKTTDPKLIALRAPLILRLLRDNLQNQHKYFWKMSRIPLLMAMVLYLLDSLDMPELKELFETIFSYRFQSHTDSRMTQQEQAYERLSEILDKDYHLTQLKRMFKRMFRRHPEKQQSIWVFAKHFYRLILATSADTSSSKNMNAGFGPMESLS